jgi:alanine dehydrogenase
MTLLLSNDDVAELLSMSECMAALEEAYVELAAGRGVSRTRSDTLTPTARSGRLYGLKTMDGVVPKIGVGAVRINSDILTWPERDGNMRREKVPAAPNGRYVGLVLLFSTETGEPLAIFPDGVLQRLRVGATNGLGAKYLARRMLRQWACSDRAGRRAASYWPYARCVRSPRFVALVRTHPTVKPSVGKLLRKSIARFSRLQVPKRLL